MMCGFAGYLSRGGFNEDQARAVARAMADRIEHRGPDDSGVWVDGMAGIALAHRRLSVVDLSPAGHQPMVSSNGRFVLVFNGEIYNHLSLRQELEERWDNPGLPLLGNGGRAWLGHSDTETLLASVDTWGVDVTLKKCVGMFAFALWDRQNRILTLARDRLGEKPLYYGWQDRTFLFGSELKTLRVHPEFCSEVDRDALAASLLLNCVPSPRSIYQKIYKLPPGTYLEIPEQGNIHAPVAYWSLEETILSAKRNPFQGDSAAAVNAMETCLGEAITGQMVADVPIGVFLSGGIDSSVVTALMQANSSRAVRTFSIGFGEERYNEAQYAKAVAEHLQTEHTEFYVTHREALEIVPRLHVLYDEPFADSSQIATALVSSLAKQHVTVALTGDGGDELFGGYYRYLWSLEVWGKIRMLPLKLRRVIGHLLLSLPRRLLAIFMEVLLRLLSITYTSTKGEDRLYNWAKRLVEVECFDDLYWSLFFAWENVADVVVGVTEAQVAVVAKASCPSHLVDVERMMFLDTITYLPDDILTKVDRAGMGSSLETRIPFLDHRVVDFAWSLPLSLKISEGQGKWLVRQLLYRYVPQQLIDRPKMGFGVPIDAWLRGPLRDWAESLLDEGRLAREGFFHSMPIRKKWQEHLSGQHNWAPQLWSVLMFQAWLEEEKG